MRYDPFPRYPVVDRAVRTGHDALADALADRSAAVVAIDGPAALDWPVLVDGVRGAVARRGRRTTVVDMRDHLLDRPSIEALTDRELRDDPHFARIPRVRLDRLFGLLPAPAPGRHLVIVYGPGAALVGHDLLLYADRPKADALAAVTDGAAPNLGQRPGDTGTVRRLTFVDWPLQDEHKARLVGRIDGYVDATDPAQPRLADGPSVRRGLRALAGGPFRTRPTFAPGPWGGQWLRKVLDAPGDGPNLAWSFELITPESGLLLADATGTAVEVGFEMLMAEAGRDVLGPDVHARFGRSFPIRFDYLDTVEGGNLSVHCHPQERYAAEVFGLPYTQHETYYVMATTPGAEIFLGMRPEADLAAFRAGAHRSHEDAVPLAVQDHVARLPAQLHRLYQIPAGTPHASGAGNVILEISSTPYLYSLRTYDWLRPGLDGAPRALPLEHAFANLDGDRRVSGLDGELTPSPRVLRHGDGAVEEELGAHPALFFEVRRLDITTPGAAMDDDTAGRFHVLTVVDGPGVLVQSSAGEHPLSYAETLVVPASVGAYRVRALPGQRAMVVKALVRG